MGAASAAAGFTQGFPVGASGSRTAVNDSMGARSQFAGLFAAGEAVGGANGANRLSGNAVTEAFVFGRRAAIAARSGGFLYCVSLVGVTGARTTLPSSDSVKRIAVFSSSAGSPSKASGS